MIDTESYGRALFELAAETDTDTMVRQQLHLVCDVLREEPRYILLLDTPAISEEDKQALIQQAFGSMERYLSNFLHILVAKKIVFSLHDCAAAYDRCYDEAHNLLRATAITAQPMSEKQKAALQSRLSELTKKTVSLETRIDPSLVGGIRLRYGGVQLDDSIQSKLAQFKRSLTETTL